MSTPADWSKAFARQADADFETWTVLQAQPDVPQCHRLLFLQMACEKLCKASLIADKSPREKLETSHAYVAKTLPVVVKQEIAFRGQDVKHMRAVYQAARRLAPEIEVLNPAVDRDGQRPDNCEYPWQDQLGVVHSPLDWTFHPSRLLTEQAGRTFLKLVRLAINRLL